MSRTFARGDRLGFYSGIPVGSERPAYRGRLLVLPSVRQPFPGCPPRLRFHIAGLVYILGKWCVKPLPLAPRCQLLLGGGEFAEPRLQLLGFLALPVFRVLVSHQ